VRDSEPSPPSTAAALRTSHPLEPVHTLLARRWRPNLCGGSGDECRGSRDDALDRLRAVKRGGGLTHGTLGTVACGAAGQGGRAGCVRRH